MANTFPMVFTPASGPSLFAFSTLLFAILSAAFWGTFYAAKDQLPRFALLLGGWLGLWTLAVETGAMGTRAMPLLPLFLFLTIAVSTATSLSTWGLRLAVGLPIPLLVAFQGFRFFLELILHSWVGQGTIPASMSWNGQNFDVISGVVALVAAPLSARFRAAAWAANVTGIALLLNVVRVAVLSTPLPFAWKLDPPLQLAFHGPYFLIVPLCIGGAIAGHVVLTRALILPKLP